jgi:hypothetical protein
LEELRKGVIEGAEGIGQSDGDGCLSEEQARLGVPHR